MKLFQKRQEAEPTIDLVAAEQEAAAPKQRWGQPGRCPECSGRGYLDHIDIIDKVMHQHCTECWHRWVTTQSELTSSNA